MARYVHWLLCNKGSLERAEKWHEQQPEALIENQNFKLLWDFIIQCDRFIETRRPDIVLVDKRNKEVKIIDIAVPGDSRLAEKELEKRQMVREIIGHVWQMNKVTVIPVVIGHLESFQTSLKDIWRRWM